MTENCERSEARPIKKCSRITNNPFFNFLRCYRTWDENQDKTAVQIAQQGAHAWNGLSESERLPYQQMAVRHRRVRPIVMLARKRRTVSAAASLRGRRAASRSRSRQRRGRGRGRRLASGVSRRRSRTRRRTVISTRARRQRQRRNQRSRPDTNRRAVPRLSVIREETCLPCSRERRHRDEPPQC